jgi:MFS family permease
MFSFYFLSRMDDVKYSVKHESKFSFAQFIEKLRFTNFGRYTIFFSLMMLVVNFAGPFFTVYMLKELNLSYVMFTSLVLAQSVVYFISMTYWGRSGDKYGDKHVMMICGFLIPIVPILWILSSNLYYLFTIQIFSGFVWAGFDLSAANFIFDTVSPPKRVRVVAYYNVIIGIATFLGAALGGLSATYLTPILVLGSIKTIFLISAIGRFVVAAIFLPKLEEARSKVSVPERKLFFTLIFLKPFRTLVHETSHDINWTISHVRMAEKKASFLFRR